MQDEFKNSLLREMARLRALVEIEGTAGRKAPRLSEEGKKFICQNLAMLCRRTGGNRDCPVAECPFAERDGLKACAHVTSEHWKMIYAHGRVFGNRTERRTESAERKADGVEIWTGERRERALKIRLRHRKTTRPATEDRPLFDKKEKLPVIPPDAMKKHDETWMSPVVVPADHKTNWTEEDERNETEDLIRCEEMRKANEDRLMRN